MHLNLQIFLLYHLIKMYQTLLLKALLSVILLPGEYKNAKIIIVDKSGRSIKEIFVNGEGQGSVKVDTSMLAAGTYTYSLYVNGKLISTKQMVNTK